jgi:predicted glycoside hydrolase/deacetylase ChbG (UPF0249 family)
MNRPSDRVARLIVNADDFGYARGVSRGILHCAALGRVTATGVMANCPISDEDWAKLRASDSLGIGVHLNLSHGPILSPAMQGALGAESFTSKFGMALRIASGVLPLRVVEAELAAQIQRCRDERLHLTFLNSHEHLHMLPRLASLVSRLAKEFDIPFVRFTRADSGALRAKAGLVRDTIIRGCGWLTRGSRLDRDLRFVGLSASGALDADYLSRLLPTLERGHAYELMCHPGFSAADEIRDARVLAYHRWDEELAALCSPELGLLLERHGVELSTYQELLAG